MGSLDAMSTMLDNRDKSDHTFLKSIIPKVNISTQLEFKFANFQVAVQYLIYNATGTSLS